MKDMLARPLLWKDYGKSSSYSNLGLKRCEMVSRLPSPSPDCGQVVEWTDTGIENAYLGDTNRQNDALVDFWEITADQAYHRAIAVAEV
jgi:hypothetical protein